MLDITEGMDYIFVEPVELEEDVIVPQYTRATENRNGGAIVGAFCLVWDGLAFLEPYEFQDLKDRGLVKVIS